MFLIYDSLNVFYIDDTQKKKSKEKKETRNTLQNFIYQNQTTLKLFKPVVQTFFFLILLSLISKKNEYVVIKKRGLSKTQKNIRMMINLI
jgi:hypothetical protein